MYYVLNMKKALGCNCVSQSLVGKEEIDVIEELKAALSYLLLCPNSHVILDNSQTCLNYRNLCFPTGTESLQCSVMCFPRCLTSSKKAVNSWILHPGNFIPAASR